MLKNKFTLLVIIALCTSYQKSEIFNNPEVIQDLIEMDIKVSKIENNPNHKKPVGPYNVLIEQINLNVATHNEKAIKLYQRHGFLHFGTERDAMKFNGEYFDDDFMALRLK